MDWITETVAKTDTEVAKLIKNEVKRQAANIRLIPSENYASQAVMAATGSIFCNKYSEGYPHQWNKGELIQQNGRYYNGQQYTNSLEALTIQRTLKFFVPGQEQNYYANVQPLSGAPANLAVLSAFLDTGDLLMGLSLDYGGHLTHGHKVSVTSKFFRAVQFPLGKNDLMDYDLIRSQARQHKPKLIICGASAYPRTIDFSIIGQIAKEIGAFFVADIAHISSLVATGLHPSPFPSADAVTTTTHKILRGPRGGLIVYKKEHGQKIDRSVFPGLQGGPHMNTVAGIAVCLHEALSPAYKDYCKQVIANAKRLGEKLNESGFHLITGGTDNHLILIDVTKSAAEIRSDHGGILSDALESAGIVLNKNAVPGDAKPWIPSGVRLGTPAVTTLGMKEKEMELIAGWITRVAKQVSNQSELTKIRAEVTEVMQSFPIPG